MQLAVDAVRANSSQLTKPEFRTNAVSASRNKFKAQQTVIGEGQVSVTSFARGSNRAIYK